MLVAPAAGCRVKGVGCYLHLGPLDHSADYGAGRVGDTKPLLSELRAGSGYRATLAAASLATVVILHSISKLGRDSKQNSSVFRPRSC